LKTEINWTKVCKGCGRCCSNIPHNKDFIEAHKKHIQVEYNEIHSEELIKPETVDGYCIFLDRSSKRCHIYSERPEICRVYGTIDKYPCYVLEPEVCKKKDKELIEELKKHALEKLMQKQPHE